MKKIIYLLGFLALFLTSCDPMGDIYNDIDASQEDVSGDITFALNSDDYADIDSSTDEDDYEVNEAFTNYEDAKLKISSFLSEKFPVWGKGSLATVSFNIDDIISLDNYEVTTQDYTDLNYGYPNFSSEGDLGSFLLWKYPNAEHGNLIELTYRYYNGSFTEDKVEMFVLLDEWIKTTQFSSSDYNEMGQSYPNFSDRTVAEYRIGIYLKTLYPYAVMNDHMTILYKNYVGGGVVKDRIAPYTFNGTNWNYVGGRETIKFGHNGTVWEPDNTINYTLTNADYALVGNGNYNNFDVRSGKDEETEEARIVKINTILLNNFPSSVEGQKYLVKYAVYSGAAEVWTTKVILEGSEYVKFEE